MNDPVLLIDASDPQISVLTLNRPAKRNALSLELIEHITAGVLAAQSDLNRRVIVLRANGPAFCAGLDLKEASTPGNAHRSAEALAKMYEAVGSSPLVTIAAVQGAAMGGGAGLLAACDLVVAADDLRLSYPEVKRGLIAALVTCLLRRQLSDRRARELILLGQTIDAARALELGLVSRVVVAAALNDEAMSLAREACGGAPGAIARTKRLLDELSARPLVDDLRIALGHHLAARESSEAAEGMAAFMEKRAPKWKPREA
ncbi:MAG TPA: enoyl-CoA hydratase-related protein [Humisphaera sp.]|jgi:methylglutaconyl-CoA hydratase|nr:enoyl-CoA hydratase-related protein [Humisphaera sp.]